MLPRKKTQAISAKNAGAASKGDNERTFGRFNSPARYIHAPVRRGEKARYIGEPWDFSSCKSQCYYETLSDVRWEKKSNGWYDYSIGHRKQPALLGWGTCPNWDKRSRR